MRNLLRQGVQNRAKCCLMVGGLFSAVAGVHAEPPKAGSVPSRSVVREGREQQPEAQSRYQPFDDDFVEELADGLFSAAASGLINASFQAGFQWAVGMNDPGRGLADPFVRNVVRLKKSASAKVRVQAEVDLFRIPCPAASKPYLKEALRTDPSDEVRKTCAIALGRIGDEECRDYLRNAMNYDASKEVRQVCSAVLGKMAAAGAGKVTEPVARAGG